MPGLPEMRDASFEQTRVYGMVLLLLRPGCAAVDVMRGAGMVPPGTASALDGLIHPLPLLDEGTSSTYLYPFRPP